MKKFYIVSTTNENHYFKTKKEAIADFKDGKKAISKGQAIEVYSAANVDNIDIDDMSTMHSNKWMSTMSLITKYTK